MKILKTCLLLFILSSSILSSSELKYTNIKLRVYNNSPRFPSFNSDALKPLNFTLEAFNFISFDSDMFRILNFNYEPYVPIKAWLTIDSENKDLNLYVKESKGYICYTFTQEGQKELLKSIETYSKWTKEASQKKFLVNKEISSLDIRVKFRSHDTWHNADLIINKEQQVIPFISTRMESFEKEKHLFIIQSKSLKHRDLALFTPKKLFFFKKEIEAFKKILDPKKIDAVIRINKNNKTAQDNLK